MFLFEACIYMLFFLFHWWYTILILVYTLIVSISSQFLCKCQIVMFSIVWEHWPDTPEKNTWTNALQNRCYMCIQRTCVLYSVVITWQSNPPISQFNSPYNEFTSVWSMFVYNTFAIIYLFFWHSKEHYR